MLTQDPSALGECAMKWLDQFAQFSAPGEGVTRLPFTPEHRKAVTLLTGLMEESGLAVSMDGAATLIGRREGPPGSPTLLLGSHQDSVRNGGAYDGMMGVILPILALQTLRDRTLPFAVEVLAFADEEGVRFPTALMGPRVLAGTFDPAWLSLADSQGVELGEALESFGGKPGKLKSLQRERAGTLGYLELHIEQGPVLEAQGRALAVVTGICGIERWTVVLSGQSAHAGTVPIDMRRDALAGAAEAILLVEKMAQQTDDFLAVVGSMTISPNVVNAVPGSTCFSVELRAHDDAVRLQAAEVLAASLEGMATRRGLKIAIEKTYAQKGVVSDTLLSPTLEAGISSTGQSMVHLMSGATHDASAMADLCPVAMLFVRCTGGISHHPDEAITADDAGLAISALVNSINHLAENR